MQRFRPVLRSFSSFQLEVERSWLERCAEGPPDADTRRDLVRILVSDLTEFDPPYTGPQSDRRLDCWGVVL